MTKIAKTKRPSKSGPPRKGLNTIELAKATSLFKSFEKNSISNQIEMGRVVQQVFDQHDGFMRWVREDLKVSHGTSLNYRNLFALSKSRNHYDFAKLDITQTALYYAAAIAAKEGEEPHYRHFCDAILEAAKTERVSYQVAIKVVEQLVQEAREVDAIEAHQKLVELSGPEMAIEYTALIKNRQLYEGACELSWARYFKYRDAHPDEVAELTNDDLAYVRQWTNAAPAPAPAPIAVAAKTLDVEVTEFTNRVEAPYYSGSTETIPLGVGGSAAAAAAAAAAADDNDQVVSKGKTGEVVPLFSKQIELKIQRLKTIAFEMMCPELSDGLPGDEISPLDAYHEELDSFTTELTEIRTLVNDALSLIPQLRVKATQH